MRLSLIAFIVAVSLGRAEQPKERLLTGHTESVTFLAFSPDGKTLASASHDRTIKLWDVASGQTKATLTGHGNWVESVAFSPDGKTLASAGFDRTLKLWDVETAKEQVTIEAHPREATCVAFSADGKLLATGCQGAEEAKALVPGEIKLWDVGAKKFSSALNGHPFDVWDVRFSPDGKWLASAGGKIKAPGEIVVWAVAGWKSQHILKGHTQPVTSIAFSADSKTLVSGSEDRSAKIWDPVTGKLRRTLSGLHHVGSSIALLGGAGAAIVEAADGHYDVVVSVAVSADGKLVATGSRDKTVRLWDVKTGRELAVLRGHADQVRAVALSRDGKTLASAGDDSAIRLWDVDAVLKKK